LTAATQRWQKDLEASRAKSAAKLREQLCDHQVWWTHTLKEQHTAQALLWKQLAELVPEKQRALEEANANIRVVNEALDRAVRNTFQSQLLVQSLSHYEIRLLCERAKCEPSKHFARGKTYAAATEEAGEGCKGPSYAADPAPHQTRWPAKSVHTAVQNMPSAGNIDRQVNIDRRVMPAPRTMPGTEPCA
jgi:hypothetical protein